MCETKSSIITITSDNLAMIHKQLSVMFDNNHCCERMSEVENRVRLFYADLLEEWSKEEKAIGERISAQLAETADLRRILHKELDIGEMPKDVPLTVQEKKLDDGIRLLREEMRKRRDEIYELLLQQDQLCEELGVAPFTLLPDPLPKPEAVSALRQNLDTLRAERKRRMKELFELHSQIKQDKMVLGIKEFAADEHLLRQANQRLTDDIFEKLMIKQKEISQLRECMEDMHRAIQMHQKIQLRTATRENVLRLETIGATMGAMRRRSSSLDNLSQSGKKRSNRDSIPGIRLQPPTSDKNFETPARSSEMPQPLIDHHKKNDDDDILSPNVPEPRRSRMWFNPNK